MPRHVLVRRHCFTIYEQPGGDGVDVDLDFRSGLPQTVARLYLHPRGRLGVSALELLQTQECANLRSLNSVRKRIKQHSDQLGELEHIGTGRLLSITAGASRGTYRLAIARDVTLSIDQDLGSDVDPARTEHQKDWRSLPSHDLTQLYVFADAIQRAAEQFDGGLIGATESTLLKWLPEILEPRYRAVLLMRLARACFRLGEEGQAKKHLAEAMDLVEKMPESDPVLLARAHFNAAWFEYQAGDFTYTLIDRAQATLASAGPDDIRHGYVATLRGLIIAKDIERNHRLLTKDAIAEKGHEAMRYLAHGVYLLIRSEDFWAAQTACWNLASALYIIGNIRGVHMFMERLGRTTTRSCDG